MKDKSLNTGIGQRLIELRDNKTQSKLAADIGILQKTLSKLENGEQNVDPTTLKYWHENGYNLNWILTGNGPKTLNFDKECKEAIEFMNMVKSSMKM